MASVNKVEPWGRTVGQAAGEPLCWELRDTASQYHTIWRRAGVGLRIPRTASAAKHTRGDRERSRGRPQRRRQIGFFRIIDRGKCH